MMIPEPSKQHLWLQKFLGHWTFESESACQPGEPPMKSSGSETVRAIGPFWIQAEGHGTMPGGGDATMILTIGYNPQRDRFVGTWIGSMMSHLWIYDGILDPAGRILTLESEGPSFEDPTKTAKYRDVFEFHSDTHRTLTSQGLDPDGQWHTFMTAHYHRVPDR